MRRKTAAAVLAATLVTGAGAVAITPASAAEGDNPLTSRIAHIKGALTGLVSNGTITQKQANKVATTLAEKLPPPGGGPRGRHMKEGLAVAAKTLGMTTQELRTELQGGKSMADVAKAKNVSVDTLIKALVADAKTHLATAVKDGKLTQAQADEIAKTLTERITSRVNGERPERGPGGRGGPDGPGGPGGQGATGGSEGSSDSGAPAAPSSSGESGI